MFGFKAYFDGMSVHINDRTYSSNEILTECLNVPGAKLNDYLNRLRGLRNLTQLREGGDADFCESYNYRVQEAQRLLFEIGGVAKKLPPYKGTRIALVLDAPLLHDCLNDHYPFWEDGFTDLDDPNRKNEDYSDKYGFVTRDEDGYYDFYFHSFHPDEADLNSNDPDIVLEIQALNRALGKLFDEFIEFVQDLLKTHTAYARLLDDYIHIQRRFLTPEETAESFVKYLADTKERLRSTGKLSVGYEVYAGRLCETGEFDSLGAFLFSDFFRGLQNNYLPKRCENCGRWFLLTAGKYLNYCDRPLKDDRTKTCRDVGSRRRYDDKCKNDPIWLVYNRAYKAHYARYMKKKMTTAQFEQWSRWAAELRDRAERGEVRFEEYQREIRV